MKSINQFTDEIAEQRLQQKMQDTGRGQEFGGIHCIDLRYNDVDMLIK